MSILRIRSFLGLFSFAKKVLNYFYIGKMELLSFLLIFIFILIFFKPTIAGDGYGYYTILEGVFRDHTLNFENQMRFFDPPSDQYNPITHKYVSKYAFGFPLFSAPLYLVTLWLDDFEVFHIKDDFFILTTKDILVHQFSVALTSLFFLLICFAVTSKILTEFFGFKDKWLILLLVFFGTPMTFYSTYGISYSMLAEAGVFSVFLFFVLSQKNSFLAGFFAAILFITRYSTGIFVLPIAFLYILRKKFLDLTRFFAAFVPILLLTMCYFFIQFGSFFSSGYESFESILPIHLFQIIFDFDKGILFWSPIIILSMVALWFSKDKRKNLLFSFFLLNLIVYGAWASWFGAWSFGNRFFVMFFPIYCIGLGFFLNRFSKNKTAALSFCIFLSLYALFLFCLFLAQRDLLHDPTTISNTINYWFIDGNLPSLFLELLKKTSFYRFIFTV